MDFPSRPTATSTPAQIAALNTEKAKALQAALAQIEKQFGKGTIMKLGDGEVIEDIQVVSTGSLDRKSTRLNSSHRNTSRMPSSA